MNDGFFVSQSQLALIKPPEELVAKCSKCGEFKSGCQTPKMPVTGNGDKGILVVGDFPSRDDDISGMQFTGDSSYPLRRAMGNAGLDLRRDCWLTNAAICHPKGGRFKNSVVAEWCRPNVLRAIDELNPTVVILLGSLAVRSVIGKYWKEDTGGAKRWAGFTIPCRKPNLWLCPTFHPSYINREFKDKVLYERLFDKHITAASKLAIDKPWDEVIDYTSQVELIYSHTDAARIIRKMIEKGGAVAFDYETNMLKPESDEGQIVCCSVCWNGKKTIAYPWDGEAIKATRELIRSPLGKIASNMKFEERWTRAKLNTRVRNWVWDTMMQAHVLDPRPAISSIKFQAFIHLGQEDYDGHLKSFLKSKDKRGYALNKVKSIDLKNLLTYCGLDSYLEYKVAEIQAKLLKVNLHSWLDEVG